MPVVASLFLEDVTAWLDSNEIRYTPRVKFTGNSGYDHLSDFVIPASKRQPERILKTINRPSRDTAELVAFAWIDTKEVRPVNSRAYTFINDSEHTPSVSVMDALKNYEECMTFKGPLPWLESLGYRVKHGPDIAPGEIAAERTDYGQVVLEERLRRALVQLNPQLPAEAIGDVFRKLTRPVTDVRHSWEDDFPIREEVEDFSGKVRIFVITCHKGGLGFTVRAVEGGKESPQKEVRWHLAQVLPRLKLSQEEQQQVVDVLRTYFDDSSSIVKIFAMQALADIASQSSELRPSILVHLQELTAMGTPAMRARGRKLLAEMEGLTNRSIRTRRKRRAG